MRKIVPALLILLAFTVAAGATGVSQRIRFARGASSAQVSGTLNAAGARGEVMDEYILGAARGQTMAVQVTSPAPVTVWVGRASDYATGPLAQKSGRDIRCSVRLPANADYHVQIRLGAGAQKTRYDLTVSVR